MILKNLIMAKDALQKLAEQPLPVKQSYRLSKILKAVEPELEVFESERIKICEKFGKMNKSKTSYDITDRENFEKEYEELVSQPVELDFKPINLFDCDDIKITAHDCKLLEPFLEVDDEHDKG
ncbi:MAG: hypothetical protein ACI4XH_08810 [Acutalibacteraceae bacterium]